jgi:hypothetical protein
MIEIRDLASITEYSYLMTTAKELLDKDIIVNPIKGDLTLGRVVIINKDYRIPKLIKPLIIINRKLDKYQLDIPNKYLFDNGLINPRQERLLIKINGRFSINPYLLDSSTNDWDYLYYLNYQLGLSKESKKLYVFKEYDLLGMKKTEITEFRNS